MNINERTGPGEPEGDSFQSIEQNGPGVKGPEKETPVEAMVTPEVVAEVLSDGKTTSPEVLQNIADAINAKSAEAGEPPTNFLFRQLQQIKNETNSPNSSSQPQ